VDQSLRDLVDGAVAPGGDHEVGAGLDVAVRNRSGRAGAGRGSHRDMMPLPGEDVSRAFDDGAGLPFESTRTGIVDENGVLVGCDWCVLPFPR
jgi:hypothetical protein